MSGKWPGFLGELLRDYPEISGLTDVELAAIIKYRGGDRQIRNWRSGGRPLPSGERRIRQHLDAWREQEHARRNRAKDLGKVAEIDTKLAGSTSSPAARRDTSLPDTSTGKTPSPAPGNYEEARTMGGDDRSIIWAMLGKVRDDDADAWDAIREAVKAHWPERKARRGLQPRSRTTRGPTKRP